MKAMQRFFIFSSGIHPSFLKRAPSDIQKYTGIGATVFFTALFAILSSFYAAFVIFHSYLIAIVFSLFWGLMIFNLDRYLVSSMKRKGGFFTDFVTASPRIFLALLIAIVIAKPLELKIFESEIESELVIMEQEIYKEQEDKLRARYEGDINRIDTEMASLMSAIDNKIAVRNELESHALAEADGTGGSKIRNMGPIYRAKKQESDKAQSDLDKTITTNQPLIENMRLQKNNLLADRGSDMDVLNQAPLSGLAARIDALSRLGKGKPAIAWAGIFIMLLFMAIETAPILVKLLSSRGPFDYVLDKHEFQFVMSHKLETERRRKEVESELSFLTETRQYKVREMIKAENKMTRDLIDQNYASQRSQRSWKEILFS